MNRIHEGASGLSALRPAVEYIKDRFGPDLVDMFRKRDSFRHSWWQPHSWNLNWSFRRGNVGAVQWFHDLGPDPFHSNSLVILGYTHLDRANFESAFRRIVQSGPCRELSKIQIIEATAYAIDALPSTGNRFVHYNDDGKPIKTHLCHPIWTDDVEIRIDLSNWSLTKDHFLRSLSLALSNPLPSEVSAKTLSQVCPSCSAIVGQNASVCAQCNYEFKPTGYEVNRATGEVRSKREKTVEAVTNALLPLAIVVTLLATFAYGTGGFLIGTIAVVIVLWFRIENRIKSWWHRS